jgi:hypothetical protein
LGRPLRAWGVQCGSTLHFFGAKPRGALHWRGLCCCRCCCCAVAAGLPACPLCAACLPACLLACCPPACLPACRRRLQACSRRVMFALVLRWLLRIGLERLQLLGRDAVVTCILVVRRLLGAGPENPRGVMSHWTVGCSDSAREWYSTLFPAVVLGGFCPERLAQAFRFGLQSSVAQPWSGGFVLAWHCYGLQRSQPRRLAAGVGDLKRWWGRGPRTRVPCGRVWWCAALICNGPPWCGSQSWRGWRGATCPGEAVEHSRLGVWPRAYGASSALGAGP